MGNSVRWYCFFCWHNAGSLLYVWKPASNGSVQPGTAAQRVQLRGGEEEAPPCMRTLQLQLRLRASLSAGVKPADEPHYLMRRLSGGNVNPLLHNLAKKAGGPSSSPPAPPRCTGRRPARRSASPSAADQHRHNRQTYFTLPAISDAKQRRAQAQAQMHACGHARRRARQLPRRISSCSSACMRLVDPPWS